MQHGSYPTPNIIGSTEPHIISLSPEVQLSFTGRVDCVAKSRQRRWQALVGGSGTCRKPALSQLCELDSCNVSTSLIREAQVLQGRPPASSQRSPRSDSGELIGRLFNRVPHSERSRDWCFLAGGFVHPPGVWFTSVCSVQSEKPNTMSGALREQWESRVLVTRTSQHVLVRQWKWKVFKTLALTAIFFTSFSLSAISIPLRYPQHFLPNSACFLRPPLPTTSILRPTATTSLSPSSSISGEWQ
ncbi:hypothetical protein FA13DRAFT_358812 [Coprinellus micaceus]|uniref:Uncharacterized protein n=1 Tax=Coprinellus micaceus TaxID=71717 RepID=A0A4Y7TCM5_COPMI|nr:hypothetical protein FA13DRAFT_358812 [Coprinellus micaceus]